MKAPVRGMMAGFGGAETGGGGVAADVEVRASGAPDGGDMAAEEPNVSEEEQREYERFVETGLELIYGGGKVRPGILKLLDDEPSDLIAALGDQVPELRERFSPVIALAATAVIVTREVVNLLPEKPDGAVLMHGGKALLEDLANLAEEAGQPEFTQDEISQAYLHAVDLYQAVASATGEMDTEAASQEFASILNAQEQGRLGEVLPGLGDMGGRDGGNR